MSEVMRRDVSPVARLLVVCSVVAALALTLPVHSLAALLILVEIVCIVTVPRAAIPVLVVVLVVQEAVARNVVGLDPSLPGLVRSIDEILMIATAARLAVLLYRRDLAWFDHTIWYWAAVFLLTGLTSSVLNWQGPYVALLGLALAGKFFIYLLLSLSVPWRLGDAERAIRWCIPLAAIVLAAGAIGFLAPNIYEHYFAAAEGDISYERGGINPFALPFVNPGLYGWLMAVLLLAAVTLSVERKSRTASMAIVASALGVLASLRRRPLLGILVALMSALAQLSRRQIAIVVTAGVIALGAVLFYARDLIDIVVQDTVANYLDPLARDRTARAALTVGGMTLAARHFPLGTGFGTYGGYVSERRFSPLYDELGMSTVYGLSPERPDYIQDTYWPHLLGEVGVAGAVAMLLFLYTLWRRVQSARRTSTSREIRMISMFGAMILVEGFVESMGGPVFEFSLQALVIAIPIGMALRLLRDRNPEEFPTPPKIE